MLTTTMTIEIDVTVEGDYTPGGGDGWHEPRHGPEIDVCSIRTAAGDKLTVTDELREQAEEALVEQMQADDEAAMIAAYEDKEDYRG